MDVDPQPALREMNTVYTGHALIRAQQRGIPRSVCNLLLAYGEETYDSRGGVIRCFTRDVIRVMEQEVGKASLRRMSEYLRCYLVQGSTDGAVITVGKRHKNRHIYRK